MAALAINFHAYGGLGAQWWIRRGANDRLREGKRGLFDYRAGSYLALACSSLDGEPLEEAPDPRRVADAWDRSAFLEAVKCAPRHGVSEPTGAMRRNCPPRYLVDELPLPEPGVLVVVGRWLGDALARQLVVERSEQRPGLWRGRATTGGSATEILCCNHPCHWKPAVASLRETLDERPLVRSRLSRSSTPRPGVGAGTSPTDTLPASTTD